MVKGGWLGEINILKIRRSGKSEMSECFVRVTEFNYPKVREN